MKKYFLLALLIAGLVCLPLAYADTADEVDAHSRTVIENIVTGLSDISDGKTAEVGPEGGIYKGGGAVGSGSISEQVYTGDAVIDWIAFTPQGADAYIEVYDGTSRGSYTAAIIDIQGSTAKNTRMSPNLNAFCDTGIYVYSSTGESTWQVGYHYEDYSE